MFKFILIYCGASTFFIMVSGSIWNWLFGPFGNMSIFLLLDSLVISRPQTCSWTFWLICLSISFFSSRIGLANFCCFLLYLFFIRETSVIAVPTTYVCKLTVPMLEFVSRQPGKLWVPSSYFALLSIFSLSKTFSAFRHLYANIVVMRRRTTKMKTSMESMIGIILLIGHGGQSKRGAGWIKTSYWELPLVCVFTFISAGATTMSS